MNKLAIRASLLIFLCFTMASTAMAQAKTVVGVSQGDTFKYDVVSYWNSLFTDTAPADLLELNQTEWINVTVTGVSGSNISTQITTHYRNGTEINSDGWCDIDTGELSGGPPFISAALDKNGIINPSSPEPWFVNETIAKYYKDGLRELNHLEFEETENLSEIGEYTRITDYYFDRDTGVLVGYFTEFSYYGSTSITSSNLISSNVWLVYGDGGLQPEDSPTDSSTTMYVAAAAAAITIPIVAAAIILKKRRKKRRSK
jgi:hypothetical protein